jgi:proliferating cell nuclear antigen
MRFTIENKQKIEIFVSIFQILKNWSSHISMLFEQERLYIQLMDKSHVCLADIELKDKWFTTFNCTSKQTIFVDSTQFAILMNYALKNVSVEIIYDEDVDADKLYINFLSGKSKGFDHFFELTLQDIDEEGLGIPEVDYDVEFTIDSKKIVDVLSELNTFGEELNIKCTENVIELNASGESTKLKVNIPIEDLDEYAIAEGETISISFSLNHLCKMCLSMKLCSSIRVGISSQYPISFHYDLGDDSKAVFFMAPKVQDS